MINKMNKFYTFYQNNSGGRFEHDSKRGIGLTVIIEATNIMHAICRAERIGLYFNGCEKDLDCQCCGDRWSKYANCSKKPKINGIEARKFKDLCYLGADHYIHYLNGKIERLKERIKK